jgi:hypothetical protein
MTGRCPVMYARRMNCVRCPGFALAVLLLFGAAAEARADCDPAAAAKETAEIRATLDREARHARIWDTGWAIGFGVVTAAQLTLALTETDPLGDFDDDIEAGLYVGAVNSGIGFLGHVVLPMKIVRPGAPTGDACADLDAARAALRETAHHQKNAFYLNHIGGFVTNAAALLVLGFGFDTWSQGAQAFALGYPVGLANTYTGPRGAWHRARALPPAVSWQLVPVKTRSYTGLELMMTF